MHTEEKYYVIEYFVGRDSSDDGDWSTLTDTFAYPYRFDEAENALAKAKEIAIQGKWGQPIKLRVMKYIHTTNRWYIGGFDPEDHYQK
jgi:hypothetical protein